jgi:L-ascorbate metabolism protein UlaG (beta-lactamase superfamily)
VPRNRYYQGPVSDHFDGVRFFNPGRPSTDRSIRQLLRWQFEGGRSRWPATVPNREQVKPEPRVEGLRVVVIGHATALIQQGGYNFLIDPVWSTRASPFTWAGPRRVNAPGVAFDDLPPIHAVLVSHNHYDHLDLMTLKRLWNAHRPRIISPLGNDAVLKRAVPSSAIECADWGESFRIGDAVDVTLVPAHHWSARAPGDRRMALWCGFVIRSKDKLSYCAGDTGYGDGQIFRDIPERYGSPDVAILPIGAYEPRWFMRDQHTNPDEAVRIMLDCGARHALGVHWGTFPLANESRTAPPEALLAALQHHEIPAERFIAAEPGDVWSSKPD